MFVCFDLTCRESFDKLNSWLEEVNNNTGSGLVRYLVGNFADLPDERVVSTEEATAFMRQNGFSHYLETSAKSGQNVNELFETITKHLFITHEANLDKFVSRLQKAVIKLIRKTMMIRLNLLRASFL